ncbi:MAG: hypothetical protein HYX51_08935 [Chloroflexi bacterium]|nr:hypothetical protein [Chloroflexota bacterium]
MSRIGVSGWMGWVLVAAGVYNLVWGALVILFPPVPFRWVGMKEPTYPEIWQCLGMVVGVYGAGYLIAPTNPSDALESIFNGRALLICLP